MSLPLLLLFIHIMLADSDMHNSLVASETPFTRILFLQFSIYDRHLFFSLLIEINKIYYSLVLFSFSANWNVFL